MKQVYAINLEEGSLWSLHWQSAQHVPLHPVRRLCFFFEGVLEAAAEGASQSPWSQRGDCLLSGGFLTLAIWAPWRRDCKVGQVRLHPNRTNACQQIIVRRGDGASWT